MGSYGRGSNRPGPKVGPAPNFNALMRAFLQTYQGISVPTLFGLTHLNKIFSAAAHFSPCGRISVRPFDPKGLVGVEPTHRSEGRILLLGPNVDPHKVPHNVIFQISAHLETPSKSHKA